MQRRASTCISPTMALQNEDLPLATLPTTAINSPFLIPYMHGLPATGSFLQAQNVIKAISNANDPFSMLENQFTMLIVNFRC